MNGIDLTDLVIDTTATLGDALYVKAAYPTYKYEGGAPTSLRDGTRYRVATPVGMVNIKVPGNQTVDADGTQLVPVIFSELRLYIYYKDGRALVAGRAQSVKAADKGS